MIGRTTNMALGTLLSRISGAARDIALVAAIGTGVFSDAYSVANSIPNILYILIAGGAINAVFVPALVRHIKDDEDDGKAFTDRLFTLVLLVLAGVVVIGVLGASLLANLYGTDAWTSETLHTATVFTAWCVPQVLFYGVFTVASQVLNARNHFGLPMYAPILNNLVVIGTAGLFALQVTQPDFAVVPDRNLALLGAGTTLGVVVQALVLFPALHRAGYRFSPRFDFRGAELSRVGDLAIWTIGFVLVNQLSFLVIANWTTAANVTAATSAAVATGFTSYQKAQLMMMLPHSVITVSLVTALLPRMSRAAHESDASTLSAELLTSLRLVLVMVIPAAAALVVLGERVGVILYGHGASSAAQGAAIGLVTAMFGLGLPAFSAFYVLLRAYYSWQDTRTPFMLNLGFNVLHLGFGWLLFSQLSAERKVAGIALAYSLAYTAVATFTWLRLKNRLGDSAQIAQLVWRTVLGGLIAAGTAAFVQHLIRDLPNLVVICAVSVVLAVVYLLIAITLRIPEVKQLVDRFITHR